MKSGHLTGPEGSDERLERLGNLGASLASLVSTREGTLDWATKLRSAWREIVKMWEESQPEPTPHAIAPRPAPLVSCGECRFWESSYPDTEGWCRFGPPVFYRVQQTPRRSDNRATWPPTQVDDWCGKGEPKQ